MNGIYLIPYPSPQMKYKYLNVLHAKFIAQIRMSCFQMRHQTIYDTYIDYSALQLKVIGWMY